MPDFNPGFSVDLQTSIASFHSFDEYAVISASTQKFQSKTAVYYRASQNDFSFENTDILNGGVQTRENADYQNYGVVQQCFFRLNNYHLLSAKLWWQASKRSIPMLTTNESGADNSFNRQADNSLRAVINWDYNKNSLHIQSDAAISNQITNYTLKNYINGFGYLTAIQANGNANSLFSNAQVSWNFSEKFTARAATSLSYHMVNSLESVYRTGYDTSRLESSFSAAIFYDSRSRFRAGVVLKQEVYNNQLSPFIPVLQCDYNVNEVLTLKANIGRNFHTPSLNDLYYQPGGNTALLPEKGYTAEMGVAGSKKTDNFYWNAEITGFFNDIEDWIIWNPTLRGYWTPVNIEKVLAYGIETSIEGNIHINNLQFNVHCNYALTRSVQQSQQVNEMDVSFDRQLPYIPIHSANVFAVISYKKYSLSWQWNYFSERYTTTGNDNSSFAMLYPYIMNDVYCSKDFSISKHLMSIQVGVYNIFNESYHSVLWQPMPGINYRISVRYRLGINSKNNR
jgi:iron complex outermembrane receptor protein